MARTEAEELRRGIERILEIPDSSFEDLARLLDRVDARDSLPVAAEIAAGRALREESRAANVVRACKQCSCPFDGAEGDSCALCDGKLGPTPGARAYDVALANGGGT